MKEKDTVKAKISKNDFDTTFAKKLKTSPGMYDKYVHEVAAEFNGDHSVPVLLGGLKCLVMAGNVTELAKKTGIPRTNIYKLLESDNNPSFASILKILEALGMVFKISSPVKRRRAAKTTHKVAERNAEAAHGTPHASHGSGYPAGYTIQAKEKN